MQFVTFTPGLQTPGVTTGGSPSVGIVPWSLSPPTSAAARGISIWEVSDYEAGL